MTALATLLVLVLPALGWGGLVAPAGMRFSMNGAWGSRLFMGLSIITLLIYGFGVVVDLPLGMVARMVGGIGLALLVADLYRLREEKPWRTAWYHPTLVFCALLVALALWQPPGDYVAYSWDEYANWMGASKQMFYEDALLTPAMHYAHPEYPPGWRLLSIYPSLMLGQYDEYHGLFTLSALHFGFLGLVFETIGMILKNRSRWPEARQKLIAWAILLCLILAEATWKLVPRDMLIERPQIYLFTAGLIMAFHVSEQKFNRLNLALNLGLIMAFGYLIRSTMIVFLPSLVLIGGVLIYREVSDKGSKRLITGSVLATLMSLPFVATYISWAAIKTGGQCTTSILELLKPSSLAMIGSDRAAQLGSDYSLAVYGYLTDYKAPLTIVAVLSLLWAIRTPKWRLPVVAVVVFLSLYLLALYWNYLVCAGGFNDYLSSLQRYIRVPVRSLHLIGSLLGLTAATLAAETWLIGKKLEKAVPMVLLAVITLLGTLVVWQANTSLVETYRRTGEPYLAGRVLRVRNQLPALISLLPGKAQKRLNVVMIYDGEIVFDMLPARYYTLAIDPDRPLRPFNFKTLQIRKAGLAYENTPVSDAEAKAILRQSDIIWPLDDTDPALAKIILELTGNTACADRPRDYFIVAKTNDPGRFICEKK